MTSYLKAVLLLSVFAANVLGQISEKTEPFLIVRVPRDIILPVIAVQPECPLRFENVGHYAGLKGGAFTSFELRNIGPKPIRRFKVASSDGSEFEWWKDSGEFVLPGDKVPEPGNSNNKIIPPTKRIQSDLKLKGPMRGIVVLMVVSVEFADGTKFQDEIAYEKLNSFLEMASDAIYQHEQLRKEQTPRHR